MTNRTKTILKLTALYSLYGVGGLFAFIFLVALCILKPLIGFFVVIFTVIVTVSLVFAVEKVRYDRRY